jgi:PAS domain S-box-containing protein
MWRKAHLHRNILFIFLYIFIVTCPLSAATNSQTKTSFSPLTLQLKWTHAFQFAGFYAADIKGFYREAGLDVNIQQRLVKIPTTEILLNGDADYIITNGAAALIARLQNKPIQAVAVIFQHSPNVILSRQDSEIRTPADLIGRRVMRTRKLSTIEFDAMLVHEGIALHSLEIVPPTWKVNDLINGNVDAMLSYVTSGPYKLRQRGIEPSYLSPINYGVDFYGDTLCTTEQETAKNPKRTKAFVNASIKGWQYAFSHQEEIIEYILTLPGVKGKGIDAAFLRNEAREMKKLIQPKLVQIGYINPGRFKRMADIFVQQNFTSPDYSLDGFIFDPNTKVSKKWLFFLIGGIGGIVGIGAIAYFLNRQMAKTITERTREYKASEQRYHDLVALLPEMIWETDLKGNLTYVNEATFSFFGYTQTEFETGIHYSDMLIPEDRQRASENMNMIVQGKKTELSEYMVEKKDGTRIPVWIRSGVNIQNGVPIGMLGIVIDVSERHMLEEKLQQAQKMESIGTLAGGIAHDFNNILSAILGYTELSTLHVNDADKVKNYLSHIHKGTLRARDLVAQILTFGRKSDKQVSVIEPALIIKEAIKLLRSSVPSTIKIVQNIESHQKIKADPTHIHQILMNLCTNGIQAMQTGGQLDITLKDFKVTANSSSPELELHEGQYLCLEVGDTGSGIDQKTLKKIFEPYFTTKAVGKGTGLGLAVVHGIVQEYKGQITVISTPEQGTDFCVYLPVVNGTAELAPFPATPGITIEKNMQGSINKRIMIIDDDEELLNMLATLLVQAGFRVCTYTNPQNALDHFSNDCNANDLILTDMTMPGLTGLQLSKEMLAIRPDLPIILMTGFNENVNHGKAVETGIKEFIQKPMESQFLLDRINDTLSL